MAILGDPEAIARELDGRLTKEQVQALAERERRLYGDGGDVQKELPRLRESIEQETFVAFYPVTSAASSHPPRRSSASRSRAIWAACSPCERRGKARLTRSWLHSRFTFSSAFLSVGSPTRRRACRTGKPDLHLDASGRTGVRTL